MKGRFALLTLTVVLMPFSYAFSEEVTVGGEVGAVGVYAGVRADEGGRAKFTEYRDLRQGFSFFGKIAVDLDSEKYFFRFRASDMGYDTQSYEIEDGIWGRFKFDLFYDEIPHNLTFNARTYFQGPGTRNLTGTPNTNFNAWNTFDYSIDRRQYGGGFKVLMLKPFYFNVSFQRENRDGIKPTGITPASPGERAFEIPEPVDYATNNLKVEGGYAKKPLFLSFGFIYSDFHDGQDKLNFTHPNPDPITGIFHTDTLTLPPDNQYYKGFFKGAVKLPLNSKFNVNLGYSTARSDFDLLNAFVQNGTITPLVLSSPNFDGRIDTQNYSFVLTSNPVRFLDAKVFYTFFKRENKNDLIVQGSPTDTFINPLLGYKKNAAGVDLGFRLPAKFYLSGGYKFIKTERKQSFEPEPSLPDNRDNIYSVYLKWSGLDFMEVKAGYEKLLRSARFPEAALPDRHFAYAGQDRDTFRASIDLFPVENFNFSFGYAHKFADYSEILGLKSDKRDGVDVYADYTLKKIAKFYGFLDYERIKFKQTAQPLDANGNPVGNWSAGTKDRSWGYGIGAEVYIIPNKLTLILQHDYLKSNGNVDYNLDPVFFTAAAGAGLAGIGANNDNVDILRWDDYTLYSFKIKAVYNFTKSLTAMIGYAYERFNYSDAQLDGYNFTPTGSATNTAFLTGAYKGLSYKANLIFGGVNYKF